MSQLKSYIMLYFTLHIIVTQYIILVIFHFKCRITSLLYCVHLSVFHVYILRFFNKNCCMNYQNNYNKMRCMEYYYLKKKSNKCEKETLTGKSLPASLY